MADNPQSEDFPFNTYRDYIAALSNTDNAYQRLSYFLATSPDSAYGAHIQLETQVPRKGLVMVLDQVGGQLETRQFHFGEYGTQRDISDCIETIDELEEASDHHQSRIIFLSYHRDPFTGEYTGVNTDVLDVIGRRFRIHPEVLMWHFGSDYGLDKRFFHLAAPPIPLALSSSRYCHIMNDHSLFSCCLHPPRDGIRRGDGKFKMLLLFTRFYSVRL